MKDDQEAGTGAGITHRADVAVIGAGVMGLWTARTLREKRIDVVLVDAFQPGHARASSSGETRVIRCGYGGSDLYAGWAWRSIGLWSDWEKRVGETVFHRTGVLWLTGKADAYAKASHAGLERLRVPCERIEPAALAERFPQIALRGIRWGLLEEEGGAIQARRACIALAREFERAGGRIIREQALPPEGRGAALPGLATQSGARIEAATYVFACGPWLPALFPKLLASKISVTRKEVFFFGTPPGDDRFAAGRLPVWLELGTGCYGIPEIDGRGFKLAPDVPGKQVDPDRMDWRPTMEMLRLARACIRRRFPALKGAPVVESRVCQYSSTGDDQLIFDRHPGWENVWLLGAGSGHAFKHGPVIGEMAADVAMGAHPASDIPAPLRLDHRPSGRNF
jgi:monomeric sarcosine oxidase